MSDSAEHPVMAESGWTLEVFEADNGREPFTAFAEGLSETAFAALGGIGESRRFQVTNPGN